MGMNENYKSSCSWLWFPCLECRYCFLIEQGARLRVSFPEKKLARKFFQLKTFSAILCAATESRFHFFPLALSFSFSFYFFPSSFSLFIALLVVGDFRGGVEFTKAKSHSVEGLERSFLITVASLRIARFSKTDELDEHSVRTRKNAGVALGFELGTRGAWKKES